MILTIVAATRLVVSLVIGLGMVRRSRPVNDTALVAAAARSAARLGVHPSPALLVSSHVDCPAIWCWGRRPVIVLPETATIGDQGRLGRRLLPRAGALAAPRPLVGRCSPSFSPCALPWHPLAWWAKRRLGQLSELACDDWVLAAGLPAADYAESLLGLVPQRRRAPGPGGGVEPSRTGRPDPAHPRRAAEQPARRQALGARYRAGRSSLAASALALAQSRPADSKDQNAKKDEVKPVNAATTAPRGKPQAATRRAIRGTVLGPTASRPPGATVFWIGDAKPSLSYRGASQGSGKAAGRPRAEVLAETETDAGGKFSLCRRFRSRPVCPRRRLGCDASGRRARGWDALVASQGRRNRGHASAAPRGRRSAAGC